LRRKRVRLVASRSVAGIGSYRVMTVKIANMDASRGLLSTRGSSIRSKLRCWRPCRLALCSLIPLRFADGWSRGIPRCG